MNSDDSTRGERKDAFDLAQAQAELDRRPVADDPGAKAWLEVHDRQRNWAAALERWLEEENKVVGPRKNLTEFVAIVKKNNLARKSFKPFTSYVESFWPDKPEEFFAQSYATFRNDPDYLKNHAKPLYDWFKGGGHIRPNRAVWEELGRIIKLTFPIQRILRK